MQRNPLAGRIVAYCLGTALAGFAHAQDLTLTVQDYLPVSSDPQFLSENMLLVGKIVHYRTTTPYHYTAGAVFCLQHELSAYQIGQRYNFDVQNAGEILHDLTVTSAQANQADAYVNWLVQNYYDGWIVNPGPISNTLREDRATAFQSVLREIVSDWNGATNSLNGNSGSFQFSMIAMTEYSVADELLAAVINSGVQAGFTSSSYHIEYFRSSDYPASPGPGNPDEAQNLLFVAPIPEPTSSALAAAGLAVLAMRRKRRDLRKEAL